MTKSKPINPVTAEISQVVDYLKAHTDQLKAEDRSFAYSLLGAWERGSLTIKQVTWVRKLADRIQRPGVETTDLGDVSGLIALFDKAKAAGIQWPKLRTITSDGTVLTIRIAGEKSQHQGQLMVTSGQRDERVYYGRVDRDGTFHPSRQPTPTQLAEAGPALIAMARDPPKAERSLWVGYGPVCAEKWALPWGNDKQKAKARRSKRAA